MKDINLLLSQRADFRLIGVRFYDSDRRDGLSPKTYYYKTFEKYEEGGHAVVAVDDELKVALVTEVNARHKLAQDYTYKWATSKVDTSSYDAATLLEANMQEFLGRARFDKLRIELTHSLRETLGDEAFANVQKQLNAPII